jgi:hypothetical protein
MPNGMREPSLNAQLSVTSLGLPFCYEDQRSFVLSAALRRQKNQQIHLREPHITSRQLDASKCPSAARPRETPRGTKRNRDTRSEFPFLDRTDFGNISCSTLCRLPSAGKCRRWRLPPAGARQSNDNGCRRVSPVESRREQQPK